jgi:iron(III) transport system substrate-binding protein
MMRLAPLLLAVLVLGACERPAPEGPAGVERLEPVVVYASFEDENYLPALFAEFTHATGIPVTVRHRPEHQIVAEVIEKRGAPPADLLLTRSVRGVWRTSDEGALRPLQSGEIARVVPAWLRDPDGYWTAIGFEPIHVVCGADNPQDCESIAAYQDLGKPGFRGRVCLSAAALAVNRTLVAGLIADHGVRPAELIVRGWVANLAFPPFESEAALLQALDAGRCGVAVVSGLALHAFSGLTVAATWPQPGYFGVVAVAINRHARSPDAARRLADWLLGGSAQAQQFAATGLQPANPDVAAGPSVFPAAEGMHNAGVFGRHEPDAVKLAERARWY